MVLTIATTILIFLFVHLQGREIRTQSTDLTGCGMTCQQRHHWYEPGGIETVIQRQDGEAQVETRQQRTHQLTCHDRQQETLHVEFQTDQHHCRRIAGDQHQPAQIEGHRVVTEESPYHQTDHQQLTYHPGCRHTKLSQQFLVPQIEHPYRDHQQEQPTYRMYYQTTIHRFRLDFDYLIGTIKHHRITTGYDNGLPLRSLLL